MSRKSGEVIVVKMGGATLGNHDTIIEDLVHLQKQGRKLVVVHGGGKEVTQWLARLDITTQFFEGERVTDSATLEVVTAILAGLVNKEITAEINSLGGRGVGLSGVDGALVQGRVKDKESGYTGAVGRVNSEVLETLLEQGFMPLVSPVSLYAFDRPDGAPRLLNINGDPMAGEIAAAIGAGKIIFLTDVAGVVDKQGRLISRISPAEAEALIDSGVISGGMIPKIRASLRALTSATSACIIDGREPHALSRELEEGGCGTKIEETE